MVFILHVVFCCLLLMTTAVIASYGDTSVQYMNEVRECVQAGCPPMPLTLRLTRWSCLDDCRYRVMHRLTDAALAGEKLIDLNTFEVTQFHGKWPFYRFMGMQEPASVLFSLMNLAVHVYWLSHLEPALPMNMPPPLRRRIHILPLVGINAWVWSAIFHSRDKMWTERADYFSAAFGLLYSDYYALVRIAGLYTDDRRSVVLRRALAGTAIIIFACHVSYLSLWRFNYGYNMRFSIGVGVAHNLLWYIWAASTRAPHALRGVMTLTLMMGCGVLEVFDFAPLGRVIDAHALWHFSTAISLVYLYRFWLTDAHYLSAHVKPTKSRVR